MTEKQLEGLVPELRTKAIVMEGAFQKDATLLKYGVVMRMGEGLRTLPVQMAYYSRSRMPVECVQAMYKAAGLYAITANEAGNAITQTLDSMHLKGRAIDWVPTKDGRDWWGAPKEVWEAIGLVGKAVGLDWGGDWGKTVGQLGWDTPHFQIRGN